MKIAPNRLLKLFDEEVECKKTLGAIRSKKVFNRIKLLRMAMVLADLKNAPGHWEELSSDRKGQFSVRLDEPYRLIFIPAGDSDIYKDDGGFNWNKISEVEIVEIINYHD